MPAAAELYQSLADLNQRAGHLDQAIAVLERGIKSASEKTALRWLLAISLATRGDTGKLLLRIDELRNEGIPPYVVQFLMAHYHVNSGDFRKARQLLVQLESLPGIRADLRARASNLLARCYSQLGEPGMQREAYVRSLSANPQDIQARHGLIEIMLKHGEVDEAIKEYRALVQVVPRLNVPFAQQLTARMLQRPAPQRDWSEVKEAIDAAERALPDSFEPCGLRAEFYLCKIGASSPAKSSRRREPGFPRTSRSDAPQANLLTKQKDFEAARKLLDEAQKELGDSVDLRLQRSRISVAKGGPQVADELTSLSENLDSFSKAERRQLLSVIAAEFVRLQDPERASRVWRDWWNKSPTTSNYGSICSTWRSRQQTKTISTRRSKRSSESKEMMGRWLPFVASSI